jgi:hypothetical protein
MIPPKDLAFFADETCMYVLGKLQRGLDSIEAWCKRWNIKIKEDKTRAIYFSHRLRSPAVRFTMNRRNIPFVNHLQYLRVIFEKITWRLYIEMIESNAFSTFT